MHPDKFSLLYVDDSDDERKNLIKIVQYDIPILIYDASNAEEGLAMAQMYKPDIIITDAIMPGHNGIWLLEQIRKTNKYAILILMSAYYDWRDTVEIVNVFSIPKPIDFTLLKSIIRNCIETIKLRRELDILISLVIKNGF